MTPAKTHPSLLAVVAAAALLAGCATTDSTYSSLPPAPEHPGPKAPMDRATVTIPGSFSTAREVPHMPPEQYADLLDRIRDGYALPDVAHYAVDREVELYRKNPDFLDRTFKRGSRYLYYIVQELERRNLPLELALLPVVESAFNPVAYSRSRASGLWQFIPSSGKHYGLEQNWWIDERRDVIEATGAALTYLQYLNRYFAGDWYLAIAAYNGGEGTVSGAVRRNQSAGLPTDFFSLNLRSETRDYVPKLLAISRIVRNPRSLRVVVRRDPEPAVFRSRRTGPAGAPRAGGPARRHHPRRHVCAESRLQPHDDAAERPASAAVADSERTDVPSGDARPVTRGREQCRRRRHRAAPGRPPQGSPWRDPQYDRPPVRRVDTGPAAGQRHPWFGDPPGRFPADSGRIRRVDRDAGRAGRTA